MKLLGEKKRSGAKNAIILSPPGGAHWVPGIFKAKIVRAICAAYLCIAAAAPNILRAQENAVAIKNAAPSPASEHTLSSPDKKPASLNGEKHRFWDTTNDWLFAGVAASRTLDYFSTLNMRKRGRQEILITNDVVDNRAGFAALEAAATGLSIGASYWFHCTGHHKLERWTSIVHIGLATTGAVRNYCLQTAHVRAPSAI